MDSTQTKTFENQAPFSECEIIVNVMKLLNDQAAHLHTNVQGMEAEAAGLEEVRILFEEINSLTECIEAVVSLALQRLKNPSERGRDYRLARPELMRQAKDILSKLQKIKAYLLPNSEVCN